MLINYLRFCLLRRELKKAKVRGLISRAEAYFLFKSAAESSIHTVEIGSFQGYSTICIASGAKAGRRAPFTAIDPHLGLLIDGQKVDTYSAFLKNVNHFNLLKDIEVKKVTSEAASNGWTKPISFLWIDGDHDYEAVKLDYDVWEKHLVPGGVIAFHDAGKYGNCWPGPRQLIDEISQNNKFHSFQYVEGIAWATKR